MPKVIGYKLTGDRCLRVVRCAGCKRLIFNGERMARPADKDTLPEIPVASISFGADAACRRCPACSGEH